VLYEYINSLGNDVCNLFVNMHEQIKIYLVFHLASKKGKQNFHEKGTEFLKRAYMVSVCTLALLVSNGY